jgi:8-oxo-dGTP pyrophosphatase MutT (NUDIX family)
MAVDCAAREALEECGYDCGDRILIGSNVLVNYTKEPKRRVQKQLRVAHLKQARCWRRRNATWKTTWQAQLSHGPPALMGISTP